MTKNQKLSLFLLRVSLGVFFIYTGLVKVFDPAWTAAGFLNNAETFPDLYSWLASESNIGWVNFLNKWGLTLLGASLIAGFSVRWASFGGIALMALYYFPVLHFPYVGAGNSLIVDQHIIYVAALWVLIQFRAGEQWGFDKSKKR